MMISPESYMESNKDKSFTELIKERKKLIKNIEKLEMVMFDKKKLEQEWICPGPDVRYQVNLDYLAELSGFMSQKYNAEYEF